MRYDMIVGTEWWCWQLGEGMKYFKSWTHSEIRAQFHFTSRVTQGVKIKL